MKKNLAEIMGLYTSGKTTLEETNKKLKEADADLRLDPEKNILTEEEKHRTFVGYYPEQASGFGLLDTGTGSLDKVRVQGGQLVDCDCGSMYALVFIAGKMYHVQGRTLTTE